MKKPADAKSEELDDAVDMETLSRSRMMSREGEGQEGKSEKENHVGLALTAIAMRDVVVPIAGVYLWEKVAMPRHPGAAGGRS
jgi:hypothetical protein